MKFCLRNGEVKYFMELESYMRQEYSKLLFYHACISSKITIIESQIKMMEICEELKGEMMVWMKNGKDEST